MDERDFLWDTSPEAIRGSELLLRPLPGLVPNSKHTGDVLASPFAGYHCDVCNKDISKVVRIRCAECKDYDLCVGCFSGGRESKTHLKTHPYIPIGRYLFPLWRPDWTAEMEILLLDAISKCGLGNWHEIAEHLSQLGHSMKREQCERHYTEVYLESATRPLPDETQLIKDAESISLPPPKPIVKPQQDTYTAPPPAPTTPAGFMPMRGDFDHEYDNDAELLLADMEFREDETPKEQELKLLVLHIYNSKLRERVLRKKTVIARNLLDTKKQHTTEKKRTKDERELYSLLKPLSRFTHNANFDRLISLLVEERKLKTRIEKLQEWKEAGFKSSAEAEAYEEEQRRKQKDIKIEPAGTNLATLPGGSQCNEKELSLCSELRITPVWFLFMKEILLREAMSDPSIDRDTFAKSMKLEASKVGPLYDFVLRASATSSEASQSGKHPKLTR